MNVNRLTSNEQDSLGFKSIREEICLKGFLNWADLRLLLLLLSVDLTLFRTRISIGDSCKDTSQADNKIHTNAHQPFTDHSPTEVSIPPLRHS